MIPKDGMNLKYLKAAFLRRFWHVVLAFFAVSLATVGYCITAPRLYKSSTLILVQPQEVPSDYVRPTVTADATSRLNTLREQVMSRPRLEEIIEKHDLYKKIRASSTMYDAVETMRKHITVTVKETRRRRDTSPAAFEVSFEGQEPAKVRDVTADIANLFILDNLKLRETQAAGTSRFLDHELERMKEELRQKEELVRQFKEKYMGRLPEQMENNHRILSQLQSHLDTINSALLQTEDRKVLVQTQLSRVGAAWADTMRAAGQDQGLVADLAPLSLDELRLQLQSLKLRYSDKHPDVVRLAATIAKLERENEQARLADSGMKGTSIQPSTSPTQRLMVAQRQDLGTQLRLIDREIQKLAEDKEQTTRQIKAYRERIESGPRIEQMFVDVRRGYEEAKENYESLLQKQLQAKLAENLERTQKGEQFLILDPANLPDKPFKPNVSRTLFMGFMLALACGLGLGYVQEHLDSAFWSRKELESILDLPVLVSIPVVNTEKDRQWNILKKAGAAGALVSMASVLLYALFVLWKMDPTAFPFPIG